MEILCLNVVRTADTVAKLTQKHFKDFKFTLAIAKLSKELNEHRDFVAKEERKILMKYMKKNEEGTDFAFDANGNFQLEDQSKVGELKEEMDEFHKNMLEIKSIDSKILIKDTYGLEDLTPQDILVLENIIDFNLDGNNKEQHTKPQA